MGKRTRARKRQFAVAFLAPAMVLYTGFMVLPIGASLFYSLTDWRIGRDVSFVGLRNYIDLFQDEQYWAVAGNSFILIALAIFIQVPLALVIAYCVHWIGQGFRFYRSVMFLPVVIAPVAIGLAFSIFLNGDIGLFNELLRITGLEGLRRNWLADGDVVLWAVSVPNIWHHIGLFIIIFIAALRGIPEEIFEAAALDGASRLAMLPMIAVPILREVIVINLILAATIDCATSGLEFLLRPDHASWPSHLM